MPQIISLRENISSLFDSQCACLVLSITVVYKRHVSLLPSQPSVSLRARTLVLAVPRHHLTFICLLQHRQPLTPAPAALKPNFICLPGDGRADSRCPQGTAVSRGGAGARRGAVGAGGQRGSAQGTGTGPAGAVLSAVLNRLPLGFPPRPILPAPSSVRSPPHGSHERLATSLAPCPRQPAHPPVYLKHGNCPIIQRTLETAGNKTSPGPLPHP